MPPDGHITWLNSRRYAIFKCHTELTLCYGVLAHQGGLSIQGITWRGRIHHASTDTTFINHRCWPQVSPSHESGTPHDSASHVFWSTCVVKCQKYILSFDWCHHLAICLSLPSQIHAGCYHCETQCCLIQHIYSCHNLAEHLCGQARQSFQHGCVYMFYTHMYRQICCTHTVIIISCCCLQIGGWQCTALPTSLVQRHWQNNVCTVPPLGPVACGPHECWQGSHKKGRVCYFLR